MSLEELDCGDGWNTCKARITYYRELSFYKRIQYVHIYLLARAWFTAQVFPLLNNCERQTNTAITGFLWRGVIFRVPLSALQRRKKQGGWDLLNVGAKSRALMFRLQTQSTDPETLTADWFREWDIQIQGHKPPRVPRIPTKLEYLRQFAIDVAYITAQQESETSLHHHGDTSARCLNPSRCESQACGLPQIENQYVITYTRHRYWRICRWNGTGPYMIESQRKSDYTELTWPRRTFASTATQSTISDIAS
jgi:hypothetical protein